MIVSKKQFIAEQQPTCVLTAYFCSSIADDYFPSLGIHSDAGYALTMLISWPSLSTLIE